MAHDKMSASKYSTRHWLLFVALSVLTIVVLLHPFAGRADDSGLYGGRSLPSGVPAAAPKDQAQLALEPGSVGVGGDVSRLEGDRFFAGYRFGPAFAIEGAQTRNAGTQSISVAGVSSMPVSDAIKLTGKVGLNYQAPAFSGAGVSVSDVANGAKLYGVGVAVQMSDNVELRAQTEHLARGTAAMQTTPSSDSVLLGANVRF